MNTKDSSIKCIIDIRDIPPEVYSLPTDGRQTRHLCRQRRALALQLATYANADGSRIRPGGGTLARSLGLSRRTVLYLLDDLRTLGFLEDGGLTGSATGGGTRVRKLNLAKMIEAAGAQSSPEQERSLHNQERSLGEAGAQTSQAGAQSSIAHNRPVLPPIQPPPSPPAQNPQPPNPQSKNRQAVVGVDEIIKSVATMGMGVPNKAARDVLGKIIAEHGYEMALEVVKQFMNRPGDLGGLRQPWAMFAKEADMWLAVRIAKHREYAEADAANERAAAKATEGASSAEEVIRAFTRPANGGSVEDFLNSK